LTALEPQFLEAPAVISGQELRTAFSALQPGVMDTNDLKVTAGAGTREISVAAGTGFVRGSNIADQGLYRIRNDGVISSLAFELGGITANGTAFPRIDQIIARVYDQSHDGSGLRKWRPEIITGVATTGATLDNRSGSILDAAIGNNWVRLADALVPAGATTILTANIRDRRPRAKGQVLYGSLGAVALGTTDLTLTGEFTGAPVRYDWSVVAQHENNATAGSTKYGVYDVGQLVGDNEMAYGNLSLVIESEASFYLHATQATGYRTLILRIFEVTGSTWNLNRATFMTREII
jgi:hypothetical protein